MRYKIILFVVSLILFMSLINATTIYLNESTGAVSGGLGGVNYIEKFGIKFNVTNSSTTYSLVNITKFPQSTCSNAYLMDSSFNQLATASFSGVTATFTPYALNYSTQYYAVCDYGGGTGKHASNSSPTSPSTLALTFTSSRDNGGDSALGTRWDIAGINLSINIASTDASINLTSPVNGSILSTSGENFTANYNLTGSINYNWTNATYYIWKNGTLFNQTTISLALVNNTNSNLFIDNFTADNYIWNIRACYQNSTFANCTWALTNSSFQVTGFTVNSESYSNTTLEGSSENFIINISITPGFQVTSASLIYNGTNYSGTFTNLGGGNYSVSRSLTVPSVSTNTNISFYWAFVLDNGFISNTTTHNQTIYDFGIDNCSTGTIPLFNFSMLDEDSQQFLNASGNNTIIKIEMNLRNPTNGVSIINFSKLYTAINPARICASAALGNSTFLTDLIVEYSSFNRFKEFYNIQSYNLNISSTAQNISLYDLSNDTGQEFKITYKDSNFVPVANALINIQRKYVDEGLFKTVEIPKTGAGGYTAGHLIRNDAIYNIIVSKNGEVLAVFEHIIAECQNPLLNSCEINLNSYGSSSLPTDFTDDDDISFTLTYNSSDNTVNSIYTIPSGATANIALNVTLFDRLGNISVCNDYLISAGGSLSCTIPGSFGNSTVIAILYKDNVQVGKAIIKLNQNPSDIYGDNLIFIAMLIFLVIVGVGASSDSPMFMGISLAVGSIVLIGMNLVYSPSLFGVGATILWFIIAIGLVLVKGSDRS